MELIKRLDEVGYQDIALVGGKAASLGEMLQMGVPVPDGFVVTTNGFRQGMNLKLKKQTLAAFKALGAPRVAVRSSAVAEDSSAASWAGQLESYLNVTQDGLVEAIEECWQSMESTRAKHYADEHKLDKSQRAVAVVVQKMVDSEISGVMFTANPVTGNRNELMVEAVYGLGEMLVQGLTTPESIVINKLTGKVSSRSQHRQIKKLLFRNNKNIKVPLSSDLLGKKILSKDHITELLVLGQRIESYYSAPQDIEWAILRKQIFIVQSRPITSILTT